MSQAVATRNRWGEPPTIQEKPVSPAVVRAFAVSSGALMLAFFCAFVPRDELHRALYSYKLAILLMLASLIATVVGTVLTYAALCNCRFNGAYSGRGLAWISLAISYSLALWHIAIVSNAVPLITYAFYPAVAIGLINLLLFAADSAFGKHFVVSLLIVGPMLSILSCLMLQSREQARRLVCAKRLKEMGADFQEQSAPTFDAKLPSPTVQWGQLGYVPKIPQIEDKPFTKSIKTEPARKWVPVD